MTVCCFLVNGAMDFPLLLYYWNFTSLLEFTVANRISLSGTFISFI